MKAIGIILCSLLVSGCLPQGNFVITETSASNSFSLPTIVSGNCGAATLQQLVNQSESALAGVTFPEGTRLIRPGTVFTHDVVNDRLNIGIAANGVIVRVSCG